MRALWRPAHSCRLGNRSCVRTGTPHEERHLAQVSLGPIRTRHGPSLDPQIAFHHCIISKVRQKRLLLPEAPIAVLKHDGKVNIAVGFRIAPRAAAKYENVDHPTAIALS